MYNPRWIEEFRRHNPPPQDMNAKRERRACDIMIDTKESELKQSPRARQYEADRKREWREYMAQKMRIGKYKEQRLEEAKQRVKQVILARAKNRKK